MRVVVDTSVARAAGTGRADAGPPSPACVAALDAIAAHQDLEVATSYRLKQEWQQHARPYSWKWLSTMFSRKRVHVVQDPWPDEIALIDAANDLPGNAHEDVAKDTHLVGLAMLTDRRVVSLDVRQRSLLGHLVGAHPQISALHWASPAEPPTLPWLQAGAPETAALCVLRR